MSRILDLQRMDAVGAGERVGMLNGGDLDSTCSSQCNSTYSSHNCCEVTTPPKTEF